MGILDSALARRVRQSPALRPPAIAAYRALDRMIPAGSGPSIVANSMPKSGTHLLASLLDNLEDMRFAGHLVAFDCADRLAPEKPMAVLEKRLGRLRPSRYIGGHLIADQPIQDAVAASGVKLVTILRDPRAVIVSGAHYVLDATQLQGRDEALELFPDLDSLLHALVFGYGEPGDPMYFPEIGERYAAYAAWADSPVGLTVRFEDLIGGRGGGSDDHQVEKVAGILDFLGYGVDGSSAHSIAERMFSEKVITFRAGRVDSWRDDLSPELTREVERRCTASMARLGYDG